MKQVLSQQEIDSLLNALNTGEIDPNAIKEEEEKNKVRSYDFRRPIKLSKEYISTLYMIFENFAKMAGNSISNMIHNNIEITIGAVEQVSYDEFIRSIQNPTLMGLFHSKPLAGTQIVEMNPQLCNQIVELMLGGSQSHYTTNLKRKDGFTDIELGVLEEVVAGILKSFESAWNEIVEIETILDSVESNPQMIQTMSPNEPVILTSFVAELFNNKSFMNICIPYISFENIIDKLSIKNWFDVDNSFDDGNREILADRIKLSDVNIEVVLGKTTITVDDFLHLEQGDIIQLDMKINDPMLMFIENKPHYLVRPGEVENRLAVEVLQYIEEDVE